MNKATLFIILLLAGAGTGTTYGQAAPGKLSEDARVSILTVGPAEPVYTMFGHTAVRVQDPHNQLDQVYNYGTFNFKASGFFFKFLYGDLDYYLSVTSFEQFKQANVALGRSIVSQSLDLSQVQVNELVQTLEHQALPENRSYRYRFFSQNCVTEVADLLSGEGIWSPSGQIQATTLSASTYRQKLGSYLGGRPWIQLGINLMLGAGADRQPDMGKQNFLPNGLHLSLENTPKESGGWLVKSGETIATAAVNESRSALPPFFILWIFLLIIAALTTASLFMRWELWWLDRVLFGTVGFLGCLMAFGAFVSLHEPLHDNWNLLWALPTHLLVAAGVQTISKNKWLRIYFWLTIALNIFLLVGWSLIPQQLPAAIWTVLCILIIRSAYRLYSAQVHPLAAEQNINADSQKSSSTQNMNNRPVKMQTHE